MNSDQVQSLIRGILLSAGTAGVAKGLYDQATLVTIVSGLVALGSVVWSQVFHKTAS